MQEELLQLWQDTQFTIVFVTHSIGEAIKVGTRILLLSPHPGRVKAEVAEHRRRCRGCRADGCCPRAFTTTLFAEPAETGAGVPMP